MPTAPPTGFSFKVASPLGGFLKVEASPHLGGWTVLGTHRSSEVFLDTNSRENSRFYRVRPFHAPCAGQGATNRRWPVLG